MKKIIESVYNEYRHKELYEEEKNRIFHNGQILKKSLNKYNKKLFLRVQDDKDLIIERTGEDSFEQGLKAGAKNHAGDFI